ncbi:MAG: hypothetical protein N2116_01230 [Armatimonadetes bacterium]|nr:hypothetical protein [Armatimonadota bacterium]
MWKGWLRFVLKAVPAPEWEADLLGFVQSTVVRDCQGSFNFGQCEEDVVLTVR